jgi:hypothetical protein
MKKVFLFICSFYFIYSSIAQNAEFGAKAGLNVSNVTDSYYGDMSSRAGLNAGVLIHIPLERSWSLQPEIYYSGEGGKYYTDYEHQLVLKYINVPLLFQYHVNRNVFLQTGPQAGFLTRAKDLIGNFETGNYFTPDFKNVDFAWVFGLGFVSSSGLGIDARYNAGLSNINNIGGNVMRNNVLQIDLFYLFKPSYTIKHKSATRYRYRR